MTKDKAIAELVRIWHSPHLDLSLKAGLAEAIDALKENNRSDSLVRDDAENCKESESKLDLVRRQAVLDALEESGYCYHFWLDFENIINSLPSAEPKTGEWIPEQDTGETMLKCSECECRVIEKWYRMAVGTNADKCPYCGAYMITRGRETDGKKKNTV